MPSYLGAGLPTSRVLGEDVVEDPVGSELAHVAWQALGIQRLELRLALVELLVVTLRAGAWGSMVRPRQVQTAVREEAGGLQLSLTFSKAMRAWVSYTSTVNSVRMPCTWARGEQELQQAGRVGRARRAACTGSLPVSTHRQVLPDGLHLLTGKGVILLLLPVGLHHAQRLFQNLAGIKSKPKKG